MRLKMFILGIITGLVISVSIYSIYTAQKKDIYAIKKEIALDNGIVLPEGINLIEEASMAEGHVILKLYITIFRGRVDDYFIVQKPSNVENAQARYWVKE